MPKNFSDKYARNNNAEEIQKPKFNFILPLLPEKLFPQNIDGELPKTFSLRKIFGDTNIQKLKKKMTEDKIVKDRNYVMSPTSLRYLEDPNAEIEKLSKQLDNTYISTNQINLIKYLSSNSLSEKTINRISQFDEQKKIRINKLCQIAQHNEYDLNKLNIKIHDKVENKFKNIKGEFKEEIDAAGVDVEIIEKIISSYPEKKVNKEMIYHDKVNDLNKHWKKLHLSRYGKLKRRNLSVDNLLN